MRATVMYAAGDVRVEDVPDAAIKEPTDAVVRVTHRSICGSDLWPYQSKPIGQPQRMGHEFIGVVEETGSAVSGLSRATSSSPPSCGPTTPATSVGRVCRLPAGMGTVGTRARRGPRRGRACRRPRARW